MTGSAALALALLVSATEARLDAGVSGEVRTRRTDPVSIQGSDALTDITLTPRFSGQLHSAPSTLTLAYDPRLTWYDLGGDQAHPRRLEVLNEARLRYQADPGPIWSLGLQATGALGRTDLVTQGLSQGSSGQPQPPSTVATTETIDYQRLYADLDWRWAPSRRGTFTLALTAGADGGSTATARETMPTQNLLSSRLAYQWSATREDLVGVRASGTYSFLPASDTRSAYAVGLATWRHQVSARTTLNAGAGLAWLFAEVANPSPPPDKVRKNLRRPAAEAGITIGPDAQGLSASANVQLGAAIDRVTGAVSQELSAGLDGHWRATQELTLSARASGAIDRYDPNLGTAGGDARRGTAELRGDYAFTPRSRVYLGAYASWQEPQAGTAPAFTEYGGFLGVGFDAPTLAR